MVVVDLEEAALAVVAVAALVEVVAVVVLAEEATVVDLVGAVVAASEEEAVEVRDFNTCIVYQSRFTYFRCGMECCPDLGHNIGR